MTKQVPFVKTRACAILVGTVMFLAWVWIADRSLDILAM